MTEAHDSRSDGSDRAKDHEHGRPDTVHDVDTDDVTERHTGEHRDPDDEHAGVTLHDVLESLNAEKIADRPGEPAERRWKDDEVRPAGDADAPPPFG